MLGGKREWVDHKRNCQAIHPSLPGGLLDSSCVLDVGSPNIQAEVRYVPKTHELSPSYFPTANARKTSNGAPLRNNRCYQ